MGFLGKLFGHSESQNDQSGRVEQAQDATIEPVEPAQTAWVTIEFRSVPEPEIWIPQLVAEYPLESPSMPDDSEPDVLEAEPPRKKLFGLF